jgi:hypothetical protein
VLVRTSTVPRYRPTVGVNAHCTDGLAVGGLDYDPLGPHGHGSRYPREHAQDALQGQPQHRVRQGAAYNLRLEKRLLSSFAASKWSVLTPA